VLAVDKDDALAAGLAVARCLSPYTAKTEKPLAQSYCNVSFHGCKPSDETMEHIQLASESVRIAQGLVDMPPNTVNPTLFKDFVLDTIRDIANVSHELIEGDELRARGYGLLWATGKGAVSPPVLLVLTHKDSSVKVPGGYDRYEA